MVDIDGAPNFEEIVKAIIDGAPDPAELPRLRGQIATEAWIAAIAGDAEALERIITADPESVNRLAGPKNWPPLLYACYSRFNQTPERQAGFANCAQLLLEHGADPDSHYFDPAYPDSPLSALYGAVGVNCNPLVAEVLLRHGANRQDGESIYHAAQHSHLECLEVLKKHGADFSAAQQPWGNTPLYFNFGHRPTDKQWPVALTGIRWLLEEGGADPNVTSTEYEETPLHHAARRHGGDVVELLLANDAHSDAPTRDGLTPFALAARHGNTAAMEALRRHSADLPLSTIDSLLAACAVGDELHARGIIAGEPDILQRLGPRDLALLSEHAAESNVEAVRALADIGFPIDARGEMGATALHHAAWRGNADIARLLVERGAALDIKDETFKVTPLDWAAHGSLFCQRTPPGDHAGVAAILIQHGAPLPDEDWGSEEVKSVLQKYRQQN